MFLNRLQNDEKIAFLEIAHHIARCDGKLCNKEEEIISAYCTEMTINDITYDDTKFDLNIALSKITSTISQKIIILEIMALIYSDDILHHEEIKLINKMIETFGLNQNISVVYAQWSKAMLSLTIQGEALINL